MNKRATLDLVNKWAEYLFFVVFILGIIIGLFAFNKFLAYGMIIFGGFFTGRFLYQKKSRPPIPVYLAVYGFVIGYILSLMLTRKADWKVSLILFIIANMVSFYLHERGYLTD